LSKLGFASRTHARVLIAQGRVRVNGSVITDPSARIVPERARIAIDEIAQTRQERRVLILHKPRGVVTTRRDPEGRRTVFDVLGEAGRGLVAVGRLDRASTGLLVFTNDTAFANWMTDPKNGVRRRYVITIRGRLTPDEAGTIRQGIDVPTSGGKQERLSVSELEIRKTSARETHLIVTLVEGKNREIRRLFKAVGHEVTRLHRVSFGDFQLGALQPGESREV
jgi:23S rRNA pseudouridine2605 synthase